MHKEVRQVLMNELGLTREVVRQEIKSLIEVEFEKFFRSGELEPILMNILNSRRHAGFRNDIVDLAADRLGTVLIKKLFGSEK